MSNTEDASAHTFGNNDPLVVDSSAAHARADMAAILDRLKDVEMGDDDDASYMIADALVSAGYRKTEEPIPPTCMFCHREIRMGRTSRRWFHLETQRYDCLKSEFDDSPLTFAHPASESK